MLLRLSLTALYILLGYNAIIMGIGYIAIQQMPGGDGGTLVRNILFLVAIADMGAIFLVKKAMLGRAFKRPASSAGDETPYKTLFNITLIITIMCLSISTYGLILVFLGEKFELLMLFVALSLIAYQFFRLRSRDFPETSE